MRSPVRAAFGVLALILPSQLTAQNRDLRQVWEEASRAQFGEALQRVEVTGEGAAAAIPEVRYARALLLLNTPPITDSRLTTVSVLLKEVANDKASERELAAGAAYFLARIEGVHRLQPNLPQAKLLYYKAWRQHRPAVWAEKAALKWLMLHLAGVDTAVLATARLLEGEQLAGDLRSREVRKNYHLLMAEAWARLGDDRPRVLDHLLAGEAMGLSHPQTRADVYCAIGNNARSLGRRDVALKYYEKYLSEFTRDSRRHTVTLEVEKLKSLHP